VALAYAFQPDAGCPQWHAFLQRNLAGDPGTIALLQQWFGYLLLPDTSLQRFLLLVGEGANGKSVICAVVQALLGDRNVCTVPLEFFGQRFHLVETLGKLANIVPEVGELDKIAEGALKAFVTGDPMQFERKHKAPFTARPTARLVLATNNAPQFSDKSDGIWRRVLLLKFAVQIPLEERIPGMDKAWWWGAAGELPGILNWALAGLFRLRQHQAFDVPCVCRDAIDTLRAESNPARRFLQEYYQAGSGEVEKESLYERYREWCGKNGHHSLATNKFAVEVFRAFPRAEARRPWKNGTRIHVFAGLVERVDDDEGDFGQGSQGSQGSPYNSPCTRGAQ
jgi:P4 family phage/plasmid primase-like protien